MAIGGFKYINERRRGTREDPVSNKHQIQPEHGDGQAEAGRD